MLEIKVFYSNGDNAIHEARTASEAASLVQKALLRQETIQIMVRKPGAPNG